MLPAREEERLDRARPNLRLRRHRLAAVRDLRRPRDRDLVRRHRRPERRHALDRDRLDPGAACSSTCSTAASRFVHVAESDREGAAGVRARARARVPPPARAGAARPRVGRRARRRREPLRRARGADHGRLRARGAARPPLASRSLARGGGREPRARRGAGDRRVVRRRGDPAPRARALRGRCDRPGGGAARAPRSSSSARRGRISARRKRAVFGSTVDYVLKNAPCRVLVTALAGGGSEALPGRRRRPRADSSSASASPCSRSPRRTAAACSASCSAGSSSRSGSAG